jgi:hypothetical protein
LGFRRLRVTSGRKAPLNLGGDAPQDDFQILVHIDVEESEDLEAPGLQPSLPRLILLIPPRVTIPVQLDDERRVGGVEVDDIGADGLLATELDIGEATAAEMIPEPGFGGGGLVPKPTRSGGLGRVALQGRSAPAHVFPAPRFGVGRPPHPDPLPRRGEGGRRASASTGGKSGRSIAAL